MCFAYTNKIPKSVDELEKLSTDAFLQSAMRDPSWRSNSNCLYRLVKKEGWWKINCKRSV